MKKKEIRCHLFNKAHKKMWMVMRLCIVFVVFLQFTSFATSVAQEQVVSLDLRNVSYYQLFNEIHKQTGLRFIYNTNQLERMPLLDIRVEKKKVSDVLKDVLAKTPFTFQFDNDVVMLIQRSPEKKSVRVKGFVYDVKKQPLPGVTVRLDLAGVILGTVTNMKGWFSMELPVDKGKLEFSFIGYKKQQVNFTEKTDTLRVVMEEDVANLDEVVVNAGYTKIEKRHLTSAVTTIKADDIMNAGLNSIDQMLEGHVPGMIFMQNSGQVGAASRLRIRGTSTVLGSQEPLWVLDGIILTDPVDVDPSQINDLDFVNLLGNAIAGVNPADIEQIDVLKDAAATALYGSRAANGVIVITTRKGKVGAPSISYSVNGSFARRPHYRDRGVNMMNASERIDFSREIVEKRLNYSSLSSMVGYETAIQDYFDGRMDFKTFQNTLKRYENANTDWFEELTQNSFSHNHTLSVSGGTDNIRYYSSIGYMNEQGVLQKENFKRYTANVNLTLNYEKFQIHFSLLGNTSDKRYTPEDVGLLNYAYNTSRAVPVYNESGELDFYLRQGSGGYRDFNILNDRANTYDRIRGNGISLASTIDYRFRNWLKAGVTLSYSTDNTYRDIYHGEKSFYVADLQGDIHGGNADSRLPYGGELKKDDTRKNSYMLRGQLDFNKFLDDGQRHQIVASAGGEISSTKYAGLTQTHRCYLPDRGNVFNPVDITKYAKYGEWLSTSEEALGVLKENLTNLASAFATVSYSYADRYIFNVNARIDGSNEFGSRANDKLLPIWSLSGRWNISRDVLKNVDWVDDMALRASMGIQGNMIKTVSSKLVLEKGGLNTSFNKNQSKVKYFPNGDLQWEKTKSYNVGLDFSFFKMRLRGTVSYYYKQTKDAFLYKTISEVNGISTYVVNKGALRNQGFELSLNFIPIQTGYSRDDFTWRFDPQIGQVLNQLISKAINNKDKALHDEVTYNDYLAGDVEIAGRPLNTFFSYKFAGLDPVDGHPMFHNTDEFEGEGDNQVNIRNKYSNMTKDEVFQTVMVHSGTRVPVIQGGLVNTFSYKGFVLGLNLTYSLGSKIRLLKLYDQLGSGTLAPQPIQNVRKEFVNRWKRPGDEKVTDIPALISNVAYRQSLDPWWSKETYSFASSIWQMYDNSNLRVASGNYLKLQTLSLRYAMPDEFCQKLLLKAAYLSFTGTNLFTICSKKLKGQEPTQSGSSDNINLSVRPGYSFTLNVTF